MRLRKQTFWYTVLMELTESEWAAIIAGTWIVILETNERYNKMGVLICFFLVLEKIAVICLYLDLSLFGYM